MNERLKRLADYYTPAELITMVDITMHDFVDMLDDFGYLDDEVLDDLEEIMGVEKDDG